jgi:hypothetical protein
LPVPNPKDEIGRLTTTINALLARLEVAFGRRGKARKGAIIGGAVGLLLLIGWCNDGSTDCSGPWAEKFAQSVSLRHVCKVGAIVGTAIRTTNGSRCSRRALGWRVEPKRGVRVGLVRF